MEITEKNKDQFVELTLKPEWGRGKIKTVKYGRATIVFERDPEGINREYPLYSDVLKLSDNQDPTGFKPISKASIGGFSSRAAKVVPRREIADLLQTFETKFPGRFSDPKYLGDSKNGERIFKQEAGKLFESLFGNNQLRDLLAQRNASELREKAAKVFAKTFEMTYRIERLRFLEALQDENFTLGYFEKLAAVLEDPEIRSETMGPYLEAVANAPVDGSAKWPNATLFPFLAQPHRHMYLKPNPTVNAADWIGQDLNYKTSPNWMTYSSLLNISRKYLEDLKPHGAADYIDVQSFIYVVDGLLAPPKVKKNSVTQNGPA